MRVSQPAELPEKGFKEHVHTAVIIYVISPGCRRTYTDQMCEAYTFMYFLCMSRGTKRKQNSQLKHLPDHSYHASSVPLEMSKVSLRPFLSYQSKYPRIMNMWQLLALDEWSS